MNHKVREFLRELISPGDQVIAAVSGGKDSMAMLHALAFLSSSMGFRLSAAHFNHCLRGAESDRDAQFVQDYCAAQGIPFFSGSEDVLAYSRTNGLSLEEAARTLRYAFLQSILPKAWIMTAHTADDNLETVLMHMIRGSGLHGLAGIPPVRGNICRPLLSVTRQEVSRYIEQNGVPHVEDSSNQSDLYFRNRIRHRILPLLETENPAVAESISRLSGIIREEDRYIQDQADLAYAALCRDSALERGGFLALPRALQCRVMARFLSPVPQLGQIHVEAALSIAESSSPSARCQLPGRMLLRREYDRLILEPGGPVFSVPDPVQISPGETVSFGPWQVSCRTAPADESAPEHTVALTSDLAGVPLTLRARQPGDIIRLSGGSRKVSRLMIDHKIPADQRNTIPVVCFGDQIAAVLPLRTAVPFQAVPGREQIHLTITRMEE